MPPSASIPRTSSSRARRSGWRSATATTSGSSAPSTAARPKAAASPGWEATVCSWPTHTSATTARWGAASSSPTTPPWRGHVEVHDDANVSAFSSVHQFCRVGRHAYVGGYTVATMDALPFVKTVGQKPACYGLNSIGLKRKGFDAERVRRLELAYRILVRSKLNTPQALARL